MKHLQTAAMLIAALVLAAWGAPIRAQGTAAPIGARTGASDASTSSTAARGQGGRGGATRGPAFTAHSPRDEKPFANGAFEGTDPKLPSIVIVGDSTAANGDPAHRGWAAVLNDYFDTSKVNLVNRSRGGRSYRTFVEENMARGSEAKVTMWDQVMAGIKPGDYVFLQLGINDGGTPNAANDAKKRQDLPGVGEETAAVSRTDGTTETVHTYGWYVRKFINDSKSKGANPIVMSAVNQNNWGDDGKIRLGHGRIRDWAMQVAEEEKVPFLDFSAATAVALDKLGQDGLTGLYNPDRTHITTEGAIVNCEGFIAALKGMDIKPLVEGLNDKGKAIAAWKPAAETAKQPAN